MHKFSTDKLPTALESWIKSPLMRSLDSASVRQNQVARGVVAISIRHQELDGVNSEMLYQWIKYFCYQHLLLADGKKISAFKLWHPKDHISFDIQKHSLSGEIGLARGASALVLEKRGNNLLCSTRVKILDVSKQRFFIKYQQCLHHKALISDEFVDTKKGLLIISNSVIVENRFQQKSDCTTDSATCNGLQNWIEHKIEEIGNLQIILPSLIDNRCKSSGSDFL